MSVFYAKTIGEFLERLTTPSIDASIGAVYRRIPWLRTNRHACLPYPTCTMHSLIVLQLDPGSVHAPTRHPGLWRCFPFATIDLDQLGLSTRA